MHSYAEGLRTLREPSWKVTYGFAVAEWCRSRAWMSVIEMEPALQRAREHLGTAAHSTARCAASLPASLLEVRCLAVSQRPVTFGSKAKRATCFACSVQVAHRHGVKYKLMFRSALWSWVTRTGRQRTRALPAHAPRRAGSGLCSAVRGADSLCGCCSRRGAAEGGGGGGLQGSNSGRSASTSVHIMNRTKTNPA